MVSLTPNRLFCKRLGHNLPIDRNAVNCYVIFVLWGHLNCLGIALLYCVLAFMAVRCCRPLPGQSRTVWLQTTAGPIFVVSIAALLVAYFTCTKLIEIIRILLHVI